MASEESGEGNLAKEAKADDTVPEYSKPEDSRPEDTSPEHVSLKYQLLGPSLTKAGQDSVDQSRVHTYSPSASP
jgi:DNA polymerase kappa